MTRSYRDADSVESVCPHCKESVRALIDYMVLDGVEYEERVVCPACRKLIWSHTSSSGPIVIFIIFICAVLFALYKVFIG
jgi:uncharacterized protein (DUF983 family)